MKSATIIDYKKIDNIKRMINKKEYIDKAINQLAYEIMWVF